MSIPALCRLLSAEGIPYEEGVPLSTLTTFRIGGPARLCLMPRSCGELITALRLCRAEAGGNVAVIGRGSNLLCADSGFDGVVIRTADVKGITFGASEDGVHYPVTADTGAALTPLSRDCVRRDPALAGLAFACGIPGSVGGAVVMNAGAYGGEMAQVVTESRYYDMNTGEIVTLRGPAHDFGYRHSSYLDHPERVILQVVLALTPGHAEDVCAEMEKNLSARREKQPLSEPSAGSVFKRPDTPGVYVGQLVESCGLKGARIGGAAVSEKHAGFIVNKGGATARDVRALIRLIRDTLEERCGIRPECEIRTLGSDPD